MSHPTVREIDLNLHPFKPFYRELPSATCGYVYLLASIPDSTQCYVGETENLKQRLREHNTGYGPEETRPTILHPWGVFAFVCGFELEELNLGIQRRKNFLDVLMLTLDRHRGPEFIYNRMRALVEDYNSDDQHPLVIVKCGQLSVEAP